MENLQNKLQLVDKNTQCIILIHGLARTSRCMNKAATLLSSYGYDVINVNYPSRKLEISQLVELHIRPVIKKCEAKGYKKFIS